MNLTAMVDALVTETSLAHKRDQFIREIRNAITTIHTTAFYELDIITDIVDLSGNTHNNFQINLPPRFRKFKVIKPLTSLKQPVEISTRDNNYQKVSANKTTDYYGDQRKDFYYIAANIVNISSTIIPENLLVSWYENPNVSDPTLETWIMREKEQLIMSWALYKFYQTNGRESLARSLENSLVNYDIPNLINNYATAQQL